MGACCCSSRNYPLHGTPVYYYYPPALEEHGSLASRDGTLSSRGLLIDLNLDMSSPDTYRPPPAPIPFDVVLGCPQSASPECTGQPYSEKTTYLTAEESELKGADGSFLASPKKVEAELQKSKVTTTEEDDVCPTCLEDYDVENPRIVTKCNHHFHLSCILEWMERSYTCPICNQEMEFEAL